MRLVLFFLFFFFFKQKTAYEMSLRDWSSDVCSSDLDGAVRVDLRLGHGRVEAWARGGAAGRLRDRLAGERISLAGRLEPVPPAARDRLARRHVGARLSIDEVGSWAFGGPVSRLANGVRRTLVAGAA